MPATEKNETAAETGAVEVRETRRLTGEIRIQGSKNAVLPVMAASLLHRGTTVIRNVPQIQDVFCMIRILRTLGCGVTFAENTLVIETGTLTSCEIPEKEAEKMRSSIMLCAPLLARLGEAVFGQPGGCSIGRRPIDLHLKVLAETGASVTEAGDRMSAKTCGLHGAAIHLPYPSVGATETALMAAAGAEGITVLTGAAREPEIGILCRFLQGMGVWIEGIGSGTLTVKRSAFLRDSEFTVPGDRIVAGTYLGAVMAAGGEVFLRDAPDSAMGENLRMAESMGTETQVFPEGIRIRQDGRLRTVSLETGPYPGFPTDLQSVMLAAALRAEGISKIREMVFEERFATAKELQKLGAHIIIEGNTAYVEGGRRLSGALVRARDLRGGAALVIAGLMAEGTTLVDGYSCIARGYEDICGDLRSVGAAIRFIADDNYAHDRAGDRW
ncbi:MAG: UDP-N-acetylglucosamine 1-carboxyvinyltransferase [Clostridiales bacterium]|nr:UDP-N-acetylglucosamine 1-carboxyvinyltransferase [Clostridiales bacterium]